MDFSRFAKTIRPFTFATKKQRPKRKLFNTSRSMRRRFAHGIKNFERYKMLVDSWQLYDNSGAPPILLEES